MNIGPVGSAVCPHCPTPLQRTPEGTLLDGLNAHIAHIHPGKLPLRKLPRPREDNPNGTDD